MGDLIDGKKTILELIKDNRSGKKLEITIPTYNEEKRINNILQYYGTDFDIVLLDGHSTDRTVEMAIQSGATVFSRLYESVGGSFFVYYLNNLTKSGCCFFLLADEFIRKEYLHIAYKELQSRSCVIMGRRYDWAFGIRLPYHSGITPKGLYKGIAQYNPYCLHTSLEYVGMEEGKIKELIFDVEHLHICNGKYYYGVAGLYAFEEVSQFLSQNHSCRLFLRRFLKPVFSFPIKRLWRIKNIWVGLTIWVNHLATFFIAIYCLIEQKYLIDPDKQREKHAKFYSK